MSDQRVRLGLAVAAIALLGIGVWTNSWWTFEQGGMGLRIGLRELSICGMGTCVHAGHTSAPGMGVAFRFFAFVTYWGGLITAGALALGVFLRETQDNETIARSAGGACAFIAVTSVLTVISFPDVPKLDMPGGAQFDLARGYGFYFTLLGGILGAVAGWSSAFWGGWEGKTYVPVDGSDLSPSAGTGGSAGAARLSPQQPMPPPQSEPPPQPAPPPSEPAAAVGDALRGSLRFAARTCEIKPLGMSAVLESGKQRDVLWSDVGVIVARTLPAEPPFSSTTFIDIVPAPFPGRPPSPIRLIPSTRANYDSLQGAGGATYADNVRKLAAFVEQTRPGVLDAVSAGFFRQGAAAPRFASVEEFDAYDAQFTE